MKPAPPPKNKAPDRASRLAAALRENLKKRKNQPQPGSGGDAPKGNDDRASRPDD